MHLNAREYDPTLGRFISTDPIMDLTDPQQWHAYTYTNNSPVTFADPSGLIKKDPAERDSPTWETNPGPGQSDDPTPSPSSTGAPTPPALGTPNPEPLRTPLPVTCIPREACPTELDFMMFLLGFVPFSDAPSCATDGGWSCFGLVFDMIPGVGKLAAGVLLTARAIIRNLDTLAPLSRGVWDLPDFQRGRVVERMILEERNLPTDVFASNHPAIDAFQNGNAISIESVDLQDKYGPYTRPNSLRDKLRADIRALRGYNGGRHAGVDIDGSQITRRSLVVAIPGGTVSTDHYKAMVDAYRYGSQRGVDVSFVMVMG